MVFSLELMLERWLLKSKENKEIEMPYLMNLKYLNSKQALNSKVLGSFLFTACILCSANKRARKMYSEVSICRAGCKQACQNLLFSACSLIRYFISKYFIKSQQDGFCFLEPACLIKFRKISTLLAYQSLLAY